MPKIAELSLRIEIMRNYLHRLLMIKSDLQDPYVLYLSKELDKKLDEYYEVCGFETPGI